MFTVSLVGVDGVGKTTVARRVEDTFPRPIKYLYMGANIDSSNYALPTTRWWMMRKRSLGAHAASPRSRSGGESRSRPGGESGSRPRGESRSRPRGAARALRKSLGFVNRVAEDIYRAGVVARYRRRGYIVLLDRDFLLDYYHEDHGLSARRPTFKRRVQGFLRRRVHRESELVICLDVSGSVAYARKGEFSPEYLEARRQEYLHLRDVVSGFAIVDAHRGLDDVVDEVRRLIFDFYERTCHGRAAH